MLTIAKVKKMATEKGKKFVYNRSIGMYQVVNGFDSSEGEIPFRDDNGRLGLEQDQLKKLASYI